VKVIEGTMKRILVRYATPESAMRAGLPAGLRQMAALFVSERLSAAIELGEPRC
jgi:hypothetical protein